MTMPESLDAQLSIYPRRLEGSDNWIVVMELGGVTGISETDAIDCVKIFDQLLPQVFGPFMSMARQVLDDE